MCVPSVSATGRHVPVRVHISKRNKKKSKEAFCLKCDALVCLFVISYLFAYIVACHADNSANKTKKRHGDYTLYGMLYL